MAKMKKCPVCNRKKFSFLIRSGADGKDRCDACETDRLREPIKVVVTWDDIKAKRARCLLATDWIESNGGRTRAGKVLTAELLNYRQKLFDLTGDFAQPDDVVWPEHPKDNT